MRAKVFKNIIFPSLLAAVFFALAFGLILFAAGVFGSDEGDDRAHLGADVTDATTASPQTADPDTGEKGDQSGEGGEGGNQTGEGGDQTGEGELPEREYLSSLRYAFSASSVEGLIEDRTLVTVNERMAAYAKQTAGIGTLEDGATVDSTGDYREGSRIVLAASSLYGEYVCGSETVTVYDREYSTVDSSYVTHSTDIISARRKVKTYMGYLLISYDDGGETRCMIADHLGNVLVEDVGDKRPFYARDYSNLPVFIDGAGAYYSFNGVSFTKITYAKIRSELYYDYPASPVAEYNGVAEVRFVDSSFSSRFVNNSTGKNYISTRYLRAFNFSSNGLAVIANTSREVKIINTSARSVIGDTSWHIYPGTSTYVTYHFRLPDTLGIESIGCSGFDRGWLRVRRQAVNEMSNKKGWIVEDTEMLINADGEQFPIPDGYTFVGYSCGVLLLKNAEGFYGYYSIDGNWIAQPIYTCARPFIQGLAVLGYADGTLGMIDTDGKIVLPFIFTDISDVSSGVIASYIEGVGWNTYVMVYDGEQE